MNPEYREWIESISEIQWDVNWKTIPKNIRKSKELEWYDAEQIQDTFKRKCAKAQIVADLIHVAVGGK
jgi:hypothetical protein